MRRLVVLAAALAAACSCVSVSREGDAADAPGPPVVDLATVSEHAAQFDEEVPVREPGSQEEFAASTYILGHLQKAGYAPLLDAVPVGDLVRSTNIVAAPPDGDDPRFIVTVAYDAAAGAEPNGAAIGLWLELARASSVADPDHDVEFVALGAQSTGDRRGARGLAALLGDLEGEPPLVISLAAVDRLRGRSLVIGGAEAEDIAALATSPRPLPAAGESLFEDAYADAGIDEVVVGGDAKEIARVLLEYVVGEQVGS